MNKNALTQGKKEYCMGKYFSGEPQGSNSQSSSIYYAEVRVRVRGNVINPPTAITSMYIIFILLSSHIIRVTPQRDRISRTAWRPVCV